MKAFAIKFNDGYYWCGYNNSDKQLRKAVLYKSIKMAEETAKDCMNRVEYIRPYDNKIVSYEIIEITIAEGDLEQAIRKKVCDEVRNVIDYYREWYEQGYVIDMVEEDLLKEIDKIEQAKK